MHRVAGLDAAVLELERRRVEVSERFGFPHGEAVEISSPGGQRLAIYELTRPGGGRAARRAHDFGPEGG